MGNLISISNKYVKHDKNGMVQFYQLDVTHEGLNKTVTIKHRFYAELKSMLDLIKDNLESEYIVIKKNEYVDNIYEQVGNLAKISQKMNYDINNVYYQKELPEVDFCEPILDGDLVEFNCLQKPNYENDYKYKPTILELILFPIYISKTKAREKKYLQDMNIFRNKKMRYENYEKDAKEFADKKNNYNKMKSEINEYNNSIKRLISNYKNKDEKTVNEYFKSGLEHKMNSYIDIDLKLNFLIDYSKEDNTLVVDIDFPKEEFFPNKYNYRYVKTRNEISAKTLKKTDFNKKIKNAYYNIYLAILNDLFDIDNEGIVESIILNGYYEGIDKRIGQEVKICIMTAKVSKEKFEKINLEFVEPRECFKFLKGKGEPNIDAIIKIDPIRFINKEDYKLIDNENILDYMSIDTNLSAMDWRDFETLIKDLFELEFASSEIEIRNTQYSNDGGIDVVAFNKNPYMGGVILLQAKRYTNTVSPEPIRALRGSMEEKKAIRGIMVTTSNYGKSSYEYAKNQNITLINGDELIQLLDKHGYKFHNDLAQAKAFKKNKNAYQN